jgi:very-short-patch-repair endonuclease
MASQIDQARSRAVWNLAEVQHGAISRAQMLELGFTEMAIKHRLSRGRLHLVRRGVYAVGRPTLTADGRRMAAVLACGEGAVLSHRSAGELWELIRPRSPALPDLTVRAAARRRPPGLRVHRRDLPTEDLDRHRGIPVTSPVRTLMDLACGLTERELEAAVVQADKLDLVDPEALRAALEGRAGQRGVAPLRMLLDSRTFAITESELERRFLRLVRDAGLPMPEAGVRLHGFKVDFLWPEIGLVVETDGLRYHRTATQQARDRRRDQVLAAAGMTPLRFTYEQVVRMPEEVRSTLRSVSARLATTPRRTPGRSR